MVMDEFGDLHRVTWYPDGRVLLRNAGDKREAFAWNPDGEFIGDSESVDPAP
jgi:hypothetical protein